MKKTLAAVAVLGTFAGTALAADVTLYGKVDYGFVYSEVNNVDGSNQDSDSFGLKSGVSSGSRFGLKGSEQISEGLTVGFQLEQGFNADDGTFGSKDRMFHREARVYVATDYGTFHFGRFGALDSGTGSLDVVGGFSASGTGYTGTLDQSTVMTTYSRMDNSIAYTSPEFAGVKVSAMVSLKQDGTSEVGEESEHTADRYYGLGVSGQWGNLGAGLVVSQADIAFANTKDGVAANEPFEDDVLNVTAGVNYDFGVAKAYLAANYTDGGEWGEMKGVKDSYYDVESMGLVASVEAPVASGTLEAMVGYGVASIDYADATLDDTDAKVWTVGAFYKYPLSKRTYVYTGAGYTTVDYDVKTLKDEDTTTVYAGLCHNF